ISSAALFVRRRLLMRTLFSTAVSKELAKLGKCVPKAKITSSKMVMFLIFFLTFRRPQLPIKRRSSNYKAWQRPGFFIPIHYVFTYNNGRQSALQIFFGLLLFFHLTIKQ